ncbi:hypothetical protein LCGC14_3094890 [marine sediment metagenome]|uniref:HTH marR-type domain-containing protein n=1 Tax=marine sediment metagenome TaxID=412755 RepID=A0A0F8W9I7_9ZZZZ
MMLNLEIRQLFKKYLNHNIVALHQIYKSCSEKREIFFSEIEKTLNRSKNQVSAVLLKLENDNLITREKDHRPQKIKITTSGDNLIKTILDFLHAVL